MYHLNTSCQIQCSNVEWFPLGEKEREELGLPRRSSKAPPSPISSPHLSLLRGNSYPALNTFSSSSSSSSTLGTDGCVTACDIPENAEKGRYTLLVLTIYDEYYNGVDTSLFCDSNIYVTVN
jgi:hypothetical protein